MRHAYEALRSTMWLLPALMAAAGSGLALALLHAVPAIPGWPAWLRFAAGPQAAHTLLATIAGGMIGVAGVTFSITIVTLAMASQQMGPRLLRGFVRDRVNQLVFGSFVATFLYSLLVLQSISAEAEGDDLPHHAILGAVVLSTVALGMLLYFIHHTAHSIQADSVIALVTGELSQNIRRLFPERIGEEGEPEPQDAPRPPQDAVVVRAKREGYVQALHEERILQLAKRHDLVFDMLRRPGDFVPVDAPLLRAWPKENVPPRFDRLAAKVAILGHKRTAEQDVEFSIDQLAEVAVRALSPGINDPFTAMRCVDRLGSALADLARRRFPSHVREDEDGHPRVIVRRPSFDGLMDAAFNAIRQNTRGAVGVTIRMLEALEVIAGEARGRPEVVDAVRAHAQRIVQEAKASGCSRDDLQDILQRERDVRRALEASGEPAKPAPAKRLEPERRPRRPRNSGAAKRRKPAGDGLR